MKTGSTLVELAQIISDQNALKKDFIAPLNKMEAIIEETPPATGLLDQIVDDTVSKHRLALRRSQGPDLILSPNDIFHDQIATHLNIPRDYYRRLHSASPEVFNANLNLWLSRSKDRRMIRTLGPTARALLSEKYRPLDNYQLAEQVLPILTAAKINIESCAVTEKRFYIKAINKNVQADIKVGDTVAAGISISNSEVGFGQLEITPLVYTLRCTNGMIMQDYSKKRRHVGGRSSGNEDFELLQDDTLAAKDRAFFLEVRDRVKAALEETLFNRLVDKIREASGQVINRDPVEVVKLTRTHFGLEESDEGGILKYLASGGDMTKWGLSSAITRYSQDLKDYDRATELEKIGGDVIELAQDEWKTIGGALVN